MPGDLEVIFRAAAGPRIGFGHLVRCRSLARALDVAPRVWLRGSRRAREGARRVGVELVDRRVFERIGRRSTPSIIVLDDPSAAAARVFLRRVRPLGLPVVSIHDLGLGQVASDLAVDGSISPAPVGPARCRLGGPRYALLDPALAEWRRRRARLVEPGRILVALGGGRHVLTLGSRLAREILAREPGVRVRIAGGFSGGSARQDGSGCDWITAHQGLGEEFARATVAVVAGGVTLYEACAIGVPVVAVPVTRLQALTTRRVARRGAARDAGLSCLGEAAGRRAARQVMALLSDPNARARLAGAGRALVDARGVFRVADRVLALARRGADRGSHGR